MTAPAATQRLAALLVVVLLGAPLRAAAAEDTAVRPPSPTPPAADGSPEVVLQWSARNEEGVYGYLVYRSLRREGPYRRINPEIIHARHEESPATSSYRFADTEVEPGRTYYYYLDTVSESGIKQRLSGVITKEVAGEDGG
jgi:hypothetical protein